MNALLQLAKRIPWWGWVVGIIIILLLWQSLSSWAMSRKLYGMALDNLREDQSKVIKVLEENMAGYEKEIIRLNTEIEVVQKQRIIAQTESERLKGLVHEKNAQILALQREREIIIVPTDPNILADEFRKRGYQPRVIFSPH